jgi:fused signal recognition particle receptor
MAFGFLNKIKESLSKTRTNLMNSLGNILPFGAKITEEVLGEVEEVLYEADLGVYAAEKLVQELRSNAGDINRGKTDPYTVMKTSVLGIINRFDGGTIIDPSGKKPFVIIVVGVNGVGKTTTIGKLAMRYRSEGKSVLLAACDTFRAAAIEQLEVWAERSDAEIIKAHLGADAAAVAYDAVERAKNRATDVVIIDTAGRLHTSSNLINELKKIRRVINKADESFPHETILVLDATNGQNALIQAETFHREIEVTGIALTKLDGTAKGGIAVSIIDKLGIPIKLIGIGEKIEDLRDFDPEAYAEGLFSRS